MLVLLLAFFSLVFSQCSTSTTCSACTVRSSCGWCSSGCVSGSSSGPTTPGQCTGWTWTSGGCPTAFVSDVTFFMPFIVVACIAGAALLIALTVCCSCRNCPLYCCCHKYAPQRNLHEQETGVALGAAPAPYYPTVVETHVKYVPSLESQQPVQYAQAYPGFVSNPLIDFESAKLTLPLPATASAVVCRCRGASSAAAANVQCQ